jgi:hypothetical protein
LALRSTVATDGFWDVFTSEMAVDAIHQVS